MADGTEMAIKIPFQVEGFALACLSRNFCIMTETRTIFHDLVN